MDGLLVVIAGCVLGCVSCLPAAWLFEHALKGEAQAGVTAGFAGILCSYTLLVLALIAVWIFRREQVLAFGCAEAASLLLFWGVEAWRAWRSANSPASGRKEPW